jgi:hypothetical protein
MQHCEGASVTDDCVDLGKDRVRIEEVRSPDSGMRWQLDEPSRADDQLQSRGEQTTNYVSEYLGPSSRPEGEVDARAVRARRQAKNRAVELRQQRTHLNRRVWQIPCGEETGRIQNERVLPEGELVGELARPSS